MDETIVSSNKPQEKTDEPALWFIFSGKKLLLNKKKERLTIPLFINANDPGFNPIRQFYLGTYNGRHCYAAEVNDKLSLIHI